MFYVLYVFAFFLILQCYFFSLSLIFLLRPTVRTAFLRTRFSLPCRALFSKFDDNGGGDISIDEFVSHVWEPENNAMSLVMVRENQQKARMKSTMAKAARTYEKSSLGHLNVDEAARLISEKLQSHIHAGGNELLQAFREFHHGHGMEIDYDEFVSTLKELGIKLYPPSEYDELFKQFDKTKTGTISFQEFCNEVMKVSKGNAPIENKHPSAVDIKRKKTLEKSQKKKGLLDKNVDLMPLLKERLMNHVDSGPNQVTRAFQKFKQMGEGLSNDGLTMDDFFPAVQRLGMRVDREQCNALFMKLVGNSGTVIDLPALRKHLFPAALNGGGLQTIGQQTSRKKRALAPIVGKKRLQKLQRIRDDTNMRELIRTKLMERMSGGANELLKAFRSFHSGHGLEISPSEFNGVVQHLLETKIDEHELMLLFRKIDTDGNGAIDYSEFVDEIMTGGKAPINYGELRRQAKILRSKEHRNKYSILNPNTARGRNDNKMTTSPLRAPRVSPIKKRHAASMTHHKLSSKGEKRWKQMNHAFMHEDVQRSGIISHSIFVHLLSSFKLKIDSEELIRLETRYGKGNGIHYPAFMKDMRKMMSDRRTNKSINESKSSRNCNRGTHEEQATSLLLELITRQWRQLQFSFSQHDRGKKGCLDMRTMMNIMTKADPRVPGLIPFLVPKLRTSYSTKDGMINYKQMIRDQLVMSGQGTQYKSIRNRPQTSSMGMMGSTMSSTINSTMSSTMSSTAPPMSGGRAASTKSRSRTPNMMGTGRASDSIHRPLTWRLKDSLSRTNKANAIIGRIRLQIGSTAERKAVLTQFEIRDSSHTNCIEKSLLRSLFARLGIKVSAADVKGLSFCFEVPKKPNMFNYKDFMRVVERGF
jgi:Ca2+-binding EF-hand superfamily protein